MKNLNDNYVNYSNSLDVLNEGFFDFVKKWIKRIFRKMFKVNNINELESRLDTLEDIIKFGKSKNDVDKVEHTENKETSKNSENNKPEDNNSEDAEPNIVDPDPDYVHVLSDDYNDNNEGVQNTSRRRRRLHEADGDTSTGEDKRKPGTRTQPDHVDMNNIDMNIPSFPQACKHLLESLKTQTEDLKRQLQYNTLSKYANEIRDGKMHLSHELLSKCEIVATDFFRKYSGGTIQLPKPRKEKPLSIDELKNWNTFAQSLSKYNDNSFKSVRDALAKVVDNYKTGFKEEFDALVALNDEKDKDANVKKTEKDIKASAEQKLRITQKLDLIATSCNDFIPSAIKIYFINSDIYQDALNYATKALEVLMANSESAGKNDKIDNVFYDFYEEFKQDEDGVINEINTKLNEFKNNFGQIYNKYIKNDSFTVDSQLLMEFFKINDKALNAKNLTLDAYGIKVVMKATTEQYKILSYIIMKIIDNKDFNNNELIKYGIADKTEIDNLQNNQQVNQTA